MICQFCNAKDGHRHWCPVVAPLLRGGVDTGAGGVDDPIAEATSRVNRSADCPEAPAQVHLPAHLPSV